MDDSWSKFWERLLVDWVAVVVFAFALQGLWFGLTTVLEAWKPAWEPSLATGSQRFMALWMLILAAGLCVGLYRALQALSGPARR